MPGLDGTGPVGYGPITGRAAGYCSGYSRAGCINPVGAGGYFGRGRGFGARRMGGLGRGMYPTPYSGVGYGSFYNQRPQITKADEIGFLQDQAAYLKQTMDDINARLLELQEIKEE